MISKQQAVLDAIVQIVKSCPNHIEILSYLFRARMKLPELKMGYRHIQKECDVSYDSLKNFFHTFNPWIKRMRRKNQSSVSVLSSILIFTFKLLEKYGIFKLNRRQKMTWLKGVSVEGIDVEKATIQMSKKTPRGFLEEESKEDCSPKVERGLSPQRYEITSNNPLFYLLTLPDSAQSLVASIAVEAFDLTNRDLRLMVCQGKKIHDLQAYGNYIYTKRLRRAVDHKIKRLRVA